MASSTYLILEKGTVYKGKGFGFPASLASELGRGSFVFHGTGELVFNTAHTGYHEVLTDPSYTGQIVAMTYPHIGNYGADDSWNESGPESGRPQRGVKAAGFVVRSVYRGPVPDGRITLDAFLQKNKTPGITDIDTRKLTLELRDGGSQRAVLVRPANESTGLSEEELAQTLEHLAKFPSMEGCNLIGDVGTTTYEFHEGKGGPHVALYDCGSKANILRELLLRNCSVSIFPSSSTAADILAKKPDGVLVSNGPGDPAVLSHQIKVVQGLLDKIPVTGICLGHQLISIATGAKTFKLKFGHHGINHPVRDELTKKVFVTSQNHGFAVDEASLPPGVEVWFRNANDQSIEGIISSSRKIASAQFHPESAPGPYDSLWIFDAFLSYMTKA